jgi:hypothetical protein
VPSTAVIASLLIMMVPPHIEQMHKTCHRERRNRQSHVKMERDRVNGDMAVVPC